MFGYNCLYVTRTITFPARAVNLKNNGISSPLLSKWYIIKTKIIYSLAFWVYH
jgi:hypothetical protein